MKRLLIVVDMQNDFVSGSLGTKEAESIIPGVKEKIKAYIEEGEQVVFTRDTHQKDYLNTQEGRMLPVTHCVKGTEGWEIISCLMPYAEKIFDKPSFGSLDLAEYVRSEGYEEVELIGLCTDICVVSNALILKAFLPEVKIKVDKACCAGVTPESHRAALVTMQMCQIELGSQGE